MIAKTAVIHSEAKLAENVKVGEYTVIGADVEIGPECRIGPHVVLEGPMKIGSRNRIFPFAYLGCQPQDISYSGEVSRVEIGDDNTIREYATIHRGTKKQDCVTRVGNNNLIMGYVHIAHDCTIGNCCIISNAVQMAGHVVLEDYSSLGGMVAVHQFVRIGRYCFIGGFTPVTQDVLPYSLIAGDRARMRGVNKLGLKRKGFNIDQRSRVHKAIRYLMNPDYSTATALTKIMDEIGNEPEILEIVSFIKKSQRGILI
ncbi:acyl-ACP--UDP-N-acetylglucosamine O-acyltransferase [bacterium]|nr:acyl-ACP--UDP-N-acetylglucosamine O-acyltransferase [bacterium]